MGLEDLHAPAREGQGQRIGGCVQRMARRIEYFLNRIREIIEFDFHVRLGNRPEDFEVFGYGKRKFAPMMQLKMPGLVVEFLDLARSGYPDVI